VAEVLKVAWRAQAEKAAMAMKAVWLVLGGKCCCFGSECVSCNSATAARSSNACRGRAERGGLFSPHCPLASPSHNAVWQLSGFVFQAGTTEMMVTYQAWLMAVVFMLVLVAEVQGGGEGSAAIRARRC
jgi:hypothetical protein